MIYRTAIFCLLIVMSSFSVFAQESEELIPSKLLESVIAGDVDGIRAAVDGGEPIDLVNNNGWSGARFAVTSGNMDVLRTLIDLKIDLNNPDNQGVTPLMAAAQNADREMVEILLAGNASPLQVDDDGNTAYTFAQKTGRKVVSSLLLEAHTLHGIQYNQLDQVLYSLREGGYVNIRNGAGWTPLIYATAMNDLNAVEEILRLGANPNISENDSWIALHFAVDQNAVAIARALLAADSNPDYYNSQGNTPRAMARERGHQEMMELFEEFPVQE